MRNYHSLRRWFAAVILLLIAVILSISALTSYVQAESPRGIDGLQIADASGTNTPTSTWTSTATRTPIPTRVPTSTDTSIAPFSCAQLSLSNKRLYGNQFRIDIENDNAQTSFITRIQITWPTVHIFAQTGLIRMDLDSIAIWSGSDPQGSGSTTTTDTDTKPGNPPFSSISTSDRSVPAYDISVYGAAFSGPPVLSSYVGPNQYAIIVTLDNPLDAARPCVLTSPATNPTATATQTWQPSPTASPTPDCTPGLLTIRFNSFDNFGIVRFDILNQRNVPSTLTGFNINWQKYVNSQKLSKVTLGAYPYNNEAVLVWDSADVNQDALPSTNSATEGRWLTDFTVSAGASGSPSVTPLYLDFEGIYRYDDYYGSTAPQYNGPADFNGSSFNFTCDTEGQPVSIVTPEIHPTSTAFPTATPTATATEGPSATPTATNTDTPTLTLTPSLTPTASLTPTLVPTPDALTIHYFSTNTLTLTWTAVSWATQYEVQISFRADFPDGSIIDSYKKTLSYTTPVLADGVYYWRVRALDANGGSSGWSNVESFTIYTHVSTAIPTQNTFP